ncbi:S41 family peptidase [Desertivirga brevis]|uniref:S41 family peptidase n=1 Tax=Desertivirga brevis TaxID=2810310 RepID=UPI001A96E760|nr:S41 family peptidase [Pedobacter sp. SYSU D00873]
MKNLLSLVLIVLPFTVFPQVPGQQKINNLATFGRLYGYVRYFHPSDVAATINWDRFLYYGAKTVETAKNRQELEKKLNFLFNPIAPSVIISARPAFQFPQNALTPPAETQVQDIYWQHYGFGGSNNQLYKSVRVNRSSPDNIKSHGFGTATRGIDAVPYRGKRFRLRSMIKTDGSGGSGQMWVRVDRDGNKMGFFDNMDSRPVTKTQWGRYETTGTVDKDAMAIAFGVFLSGKGKVWADNFILEFEDQGKWKVHELKNSSFETSAAKAEDWNTASPGYIYEVVDDAATDGKRSLLIRNKINETIDTAIYKQRPAFGDFLQKDLGSGILVMIPLVLKGSSTHTYPVGDSTALKAIQSAMNASSPQQFNPSDPYVRLAGVITTWNIFKHFYPYHDEIETRWDEQLPASLTTASTIKTGKEYLILLQQLTEKLADGHVSVSGPESPEWFTIPVALTLAEEKIVIDKVYHNDKTIPEVPLKPGDVVLKVNGKPALDALDELRSRISGSKQWKTDVALRQLFLGKQDSEIRLVVQQVGQAEREVVLKRAPFSSTNDKEAIRYLGDDNYYIDISTASMDSIRAALPNLSKAKGIICDLRGYPKGNHELINHLLTVKDTNKWMFVPRISYPDYEKVSFDSMGWDMKPKEPHLSGKVVFLTGGGAISYAESYMSFIKQYKLATIVGQPTAGANGNVNMFRLPGNYIVRFTGMKVRQQDGSQLQAKGIQPDILVEQTIKAISEGRDEYMEKALEIISSSKTAPGNSIHFMDSPVKQKF